MGRLSFTLLLSNRGSPCRSGCPNTSPSRSPQRPYWSRIRPCPRFEPHHALPRSAWPPAWVLFPNHPSPTVSPNTSTLTIAISCRVLTRPLALAAATVVLAHGSCGPLPCISCAPPTGHCAAFHGGLLYLRPRNADVSYAVPINGPIVGPPANNPIQVGGVGILDPDYESAFVAGLNYALDCDTSLAASYMSLDSNTRDTIQTAAPNVLRSLVAHPSTASAATDFLQASANLGIDFDLADVAIRQLWFAQDYFSLNYVWGARYAKLQQQFASEFVNNGVENVGTDIDFDGGGLRLGLEAERMSRRTRFGVYAKGAASFVAGRFRRQLSATSGLRSHRRPDELGSWTHRPHSGCRAGYLLDQLAATTGISGPGMSSADGTTSPRRKTSSPAFSRTTFAAWKRRSPSTDYWPRLSCDSDDAIAPNGAALCQPRVERESTANERNPGSDDKKSENPNGEVLS